MNYLRSESWLNPYRLRNYNCIECKFDYGVIKIERRSLIALLAEKFVASRKQAKIKSDVRHRCAGARVSHCACATYHEGFARTSSGRRASNSKFHLSCGLAFERSGRILCRRFELQYECHSVRSDWWCCVLGVTLMLWSVIDPASYRGRLPLVCSSFVYFDPCQ